MRRGNYFWGAILVLAGILFLLDNLGYLDAIDVNIWNLLWPAFLILLGLWFLWGTLFGSRVLASERVVIPREGAERARIRMGHGAGRLAISAGASPENLLEGAFTGGLDYRVNRDSQETSVDMRVPSDSIWVFPFTWGPGSGHEWEVGLNPEILLALDLNTGANDARVDLANLKVADLRLKTGASATDLTLPANAGSTRAMIEAGVASVTVHIPASVAARIEAKGGLSDIHVNPSRFQRRGDVFQSPDYETAMNKVELLVQMGVGTVKIS